jgi:chromosome segregation ATPase
MSGYEPELMPSETLERLVHLLRVYEATPAVVSDAEPHDAAEAGGCIRQHMLLSFRCEFLHMLRDEEQRLSPALQANLTALRTWHEQYAATAIVDQYACGHMVQLYNDLRKQHSKHKMLCTELNEFHAEIADAKAQRDALCAECERVRAECARQRELVQGAEQRLAQVQAEAQQQSEMLSETKQDQKKMRKLVVELQNSKKALDAEIHLLRRQQGKEKALLCHEQGLPGLEQAVHDLEKVLESTPLYKMMACQALSNIDGCALEL